ncbi:MAG TPA: hypothetical protein ENI27_08165 [bacterium]|nr:hypothetical protein [bacterium]
MNPDQVSVLSLSDVVNPFLYSPQIRKRFSHIDLVIACGDLPYYYLEYIISALDVRLFFVRGNHDKTVEYSEEGQRRGPGGGTDLHRRIVNFRGLLLAGIEGCQRYRPGPFQYSQTQMWLNVLGLVPGLFMNRILHGRYVDVFVTHAPPRGVHDDTDFTHHGIDAFRWLIQVFQPAYHFHGHIHVYKSNETTETWIGGTKVINTYRFRETTLHFSAGRK